MKTQFLLSKNKTAEALDISPRMVDYLIARKELSVVRIGRRVLIPKKALDRFVRK